MMARILFFCIFMFTAINATAQCTIIDEIRGELEIKSPLRANYKVYKKWTIRSSDCEDHSRISLHYDSFSSLNRLQLNIYNAGGKLIKRLGKRDFNDVSAARGFEINDLRILYYKNQYTKYPYTLELSYVREFKSLLFLPAFIPLFQKNTALKKAHFKVVTPTDYHLRYQANLVDSVEIMRGEDASIYQWYFSPLELNNFEILTPHYIQQLPWIKTAPGIFETEGTTGNLTSWQGLGDWVWTLSLDRDELPLETVEYLQSHFGNIKDPLKRIQSVYEWMQSKTRYVSVQLGLGGWQPFSAMEVDKNGYGDCKALVNYTRAALETVGIKSHHALINTQKRDIDVNFPCQAFNHMILCVPLKEDTVWLECTSQITPVNYLGSNLCNKYALVVKEGASKLVQTPDMFHGKGTIVNTAKVDLLTNGAANFVLNTTVSDRLYEHFEGFPYQTVREQKDIMLDFLLLPIKNIDSLYFNVNSPSKLSTSITCHIYGEGFYTSVLNGIAFSPSFIKTIFPDLPADHYRKNDIEIPFAIQQTDSIRISVPAGFIVEHLPDNKDKVTEYGRFSLSYESDDKTILCTAERILHKGIYKAGDYNSIRQFILEMEGAFDRKALIKRGEF